MYRIYRYAVDLYRLEMSPVGIFWGLRGHSPNKIAMSVLCTDKLRILQKNSR